MTSDQDHSQVNFDDFATNYDDELAQGLKVSGEDKDFFAHSRLAFLARVLERMERVGQLPQWPQSVLDFGCGTGSAVPHMLELLRCQSILGTDISQGSIEVATRQHGSDRVKFEVFDSYRSYGTFDTAFCNGVFHHIDPSQRQDALASILQSLKPGGLFAFWENNPWNPGTRYVMSRIPFDRDAIPLTPVYALRQLRQAGFEVIRIDFMFLFPRFLRHLRPIEPSLSRLPLGAQYQVLCRRP